jgi:pimeloyl-ACP methyl ester carboxylesterase
MLKQARTEILDIAYRETGAADGWPVLLLHGFPYDIHAFDAVAPILGAEGARVIVPYLRGFGGTFFRSEKTLRSGQQAALGDDVRALLDALNIPQAILAGFDWGARAACIGAALWPQRVRGLVSQNGYSIQDIAKSNQPEDARTERRLWYQFYFHGERGRAGLAQNRRGLCQLLWRLWSPRWEFDEMTYEKSAAAFENPDFVDIVIHSYRHRFGLAAGDPDYAAVEWRLARQPPVEVPAICLDGADDGVNLPEGAAAHAPHFTSRFEYRLIPGAGHNVPQEAPGAFADAVLSVHRWTLE